MLKNLTRRTVVATKLKFCNNILSKATGLMFSKKQDKGWIFDFKKEKIISLHMLFVFYPIDVLFLNKDKKVVEIKENFMPFSFYMPKKKARYVVEVPEGSIERSKTKLGDKINIRDH